MVHYPYIYNQIIGHRAQIVWHRDRVLSYCLSALLDLVPHVPYCSETYGFNVS